MDKLRLSTFTRRTIPRVTCICSGYRTTGLATFNTRRMMGIGFGTNSYTWTNAFVYSKTDERGLTVTNTWDAFGRLLKVLYPDGTYVTNVYTNLDLVMTIDRMGFTNSFDYNDFRQMLHKIDALSRTNTYSYCDCSSLSSVTDPLNQTTSFSYDYAGRRLYTLYPDGSWVTNNFDLMDRLTNVLDSTGASLTNWYNNQGLIVAVSNKVGQLQSARFDILDRTTNSVDANGVTITNTYDNIDRLLTRGYPDGGVEKFVYSLNIAGVSSYTNQLGSNVVNYAYDALGRKTNEVNPGITTNKYTYGPASDLLTLTDGKKQTTTWRYDQYGRTTNKVDATSAEIFRYQYNADNRLTNRWSTAKGATTYKYDQVGNLTNVVYPVSTNIVMRYDALNRLTNMVDAVGTTVYSYANQFLASEDGPWDNDTVSYTYANRLRGGLTLLQPNASSWTQSYSYDEGNRLQSLSSPAGVFGYSYNVGQSVSPASLVRRLTFPNGAYITNAFDSVARL